MAAPDSSVDSRLSLFPALDSPSPMLDETRPRPLPSPPKQSDFGDLGLCAAMCLLSLFAIGLAIASLWPGRNEQLLQLLQVPAVLAVAVLLSLYAACDGRWKRAVTACACCLLGTAILAVSVWSSNLTAAVLLSGLLVCCCFTPILLRRYGIQLRFVSSAVHAEPLEDSSENGGAQTTQDISAPADSAEYSPRRPNPAPEASVSWSSIAESSEGLETVDPWDAQRDQMIEDPTLQQRTSRSIRSGQDTLCVLVRCSFEAKQVNQSIHIPVWPFFSQAPDVDAEVVDGPDAVAKIAEAKPFGIRLDVRLAASLDQPTVVLLELLASAEARAAFGDTSDAA